MNDAVNLPNEVIHLLLGGIITVATLGFGVIGWLYRDAVRRTALNEAAIHKACLEVAETRAAVTRIEGYLRLHPYIYTHR